MNIFFHNNPIATIQDSHNLLNAELKTLIKHGDKRTKDSTLRVCY